MFFSRLSGLAFLVAGICMPSAAMADGTPATTNKYVEWISEGGESKQLVQLALLNQQNAYRTANIMLDMRGDQPLYCPPASITLTSEQVLNIFSAFSSKHPKTLEMPPFLTMLYALQHTFPCG